MNVAREAALLTTAIESYGWFRADMNRRGQTMVSGNPWPEWDELPEDLKAEWIKSIRKGVEK